MADTSKKITEKKTAPEEKTSSSKSSKGFFNSGLFKFILVCVLAFVGYKLYTNWVHEESVDSAKQLQSELRSATSAYKNGRGYVEEGYITAYQDAAYKCIQNYKGKRVKSKGKADQGVWVKFDDGMTMVVNPPLDDYLNADLSKQTVITCYSPHQFSDNAQPYVNVIESSPALFTNVFSKASIDNKTGSAVTINSMKSMGRSSTQQIVYWFGHGSYAGTDGSVLILNEQINWKRLETDQDYYEDFTEGRLVFDNENRVAITAAFVDKYIKNLDGALIYLGACESGRDTKLAQAFLKAGADTVICYTKRTRVTYHAELLQAFTRTMCEPDANGKYPTASAALGTATIMVGMDDSVRGGIGSKPIIVGNGNYSLQAPAVKSTTSSSTSTNKNSNTTSSSNSQSKNNSGTSTSSNGGNTKNNTSNQSNNNSSKSSTGNTNKNNNGSTSNNSDANNNGGSANTNNNNGQTAPMPSITITENDLIGYWSPDINAREPMIIQFYKENGQLRYHYYRVLLGDGNGFNIGFENTEWEFHSGRVELFANQGRCTCIMDGSDKSKLGFYLDEIDKGKITKDYDGEIFYRVNQ